MRHEEAAAFAAAADAALTGGLAVCAGSCGPGNLHLINGLFDAQRTRVPVLAIAAQIPLDEVGSQYFQETHPQELFRECSVYCELVSKAEMAPRIVEMAMRSAIEQRGVAIVVVPGEVFLSQLSNPDWTIGPVLPTRSVLRPADESLRQAADILNRSTRTTILAGAGCAGAHDEVVELAWTLRAPIVHALRGKERVLSTVCWTAAAVHVIVGTRPSPRNTRRCRAACTQSGAAPRHQQRNISGDDHE